MLNGEIAALVDVPQRRDRPKCLVQHIYGIGYATIVSLFFVLRWMVLAPLIVERKKARKRSDDRSGRGVISHRRR